MREFSECVSEAEHRRLTEFLSSLRTPCEVRFSGESDFGKGGFADEFTSRLLAHHCFIGAPLFQDSFESAFVDGCRAAGRSVEVAPHGARFWDVAVDGRRISLKSTKAKNLNPRFLHVSKLTEAAWIQDCRTAAARCDKTKQLFREYSEEVDSIIQLRYFAKENRYDLVEVPTTMLAQVADVPRSEFTSEGPTIRIPVGSKAPDFTLKLDRSDAKITLARIDVSKCLVHAEWQLSTNEE